MQCRLSQPPSVGMKPVSTVAGGTTRYTTQPSNNRNVLRSPAEAEVPGGPCGTDLSCLARGSLIPFKDEPEQPAPPCYRGRASDDCRSGAALEAGR